MKALLDTCLIMDFLQNREPFAQDAKKIMQAAAMELFTGCITAKSATDIYYLTHRCTHSDKVRNCHEITYKSCLPFSPIAVHKK